MNINYGLSQKLGEALKSRGLMLALAESCTGGGLSEEITAVAGSSAWFDRAFITYSNEAKHDLLQVPVEVLETHGAVSEETVRAMAAGALNNSKADIALSITGVAGPDGGTPEKPVGLVWFGLATRDGRLEARQGTFTSGRKHVRRSAISFALQWLLDAL